MMGDGSYQQHHGKSRRSAVLYSAAPITTGGVPATPLSQQVPSTRTEQPAAEPTHLLGVLQHAAAHTQPAEASRPKP